MVNNRHGLAKIEKVCILTVNLKKYINLHRAEVDAGVMEGATQLS